MTNKRYKNNKSSKLASQSLETKLEDPWLEDPLVIRYFLEQRPHYEHLCNEVAYALTKFLGDAGIKVAAITLRAKTLESFLEKIKRKIYSDPFTQITDFAGVRVVCYYPDDIPKIEKIIRSEFDVVEKESKLQDQNIDRFGYSATHFLIRLGERASGARYDELKGKLCEIQVRTVLQDAWAIFSHYLMYKHESDVPDTLKREINALAGALETADNAFQAIRDRRDVYIESVAKSSLADQLENVNINLDSLTEYMARKFPSRPIDPDGVLSHWASILLKKEYFNLQQVDELLNDTEKARSWYATLVPIPNKASAYELARAIFITYEDVRSDLNLDPEHRKLLKEASNIK